MGAGPGLGPFAQEIYIRPFGEMNGYWNAYCAYTKTGAIKPHHRTSWFRKAFARFTNEPLGKAAYRQYITPLG